MAGFATGVFLLFSLLTCAQAPMEFNFQAAARSATGSVMSDMDIKVRLTIKEEAPAGKPEYTEIRSVHTNQFGMFTVAIGSKGAYYASGSLRDVQWSKGKKYLQVEVDMKGRNQYVDLGVTQLLSVPFALFSLETAHKEGAPVFASNGLSATETGLQIGNDQGDSSAVLLNNRDIPLNGHSLQLKDGAGQINLSKGLITVQSDSVSNDDGVATGGPVMLFNPINPRPDAVPFIFSRSSTKQHNNSASPNEVFMWGQNLGHGGNAYLPTLPAIGYSLESNYLPDPNTRFVESHELYISPRGNQIRLKSYTINTALDRIDFYHSLDNFSLRKPLTGSEYFYVANEGTTSVANLQTSNGVFSIRASDDQTVMLENGYGPDANLLFRNWGTIQLPGIILSNGYNRFNAHTVPEDDYRYSLGTSSNRWAEVCSYKYSGERMILKPGWAAYDNAAPTAALDIVAKDGFSQLRMRASYTPTSTNDPNGEVGAMAWDENYVYVKTAAGWKRSGLSVF